LFLSIPLQTATAVQTTSSTLPAVTNVITTTVTIPGTSTMYVASPHLRTSSLILTRF
jgi:hypothetical protein